MRIAITGFAFGAVLGYLVFPSVVNVILVAIGTAVGSVGIARVCAWLLRSS
ncbi:hypothetical protein [Sphingomonas sp. Leaf62]|uniref:hypothetical protein n=1 Tax=Sphingomonas sp. Leaf62 TaxID=1736228 RepID=UPI000B09FB35|nr:hypothetical protein [Sphingomonas sp. Leaf62]